jgi:hypothetical protein
MGTGIKIVTHVGTRMNVWIFFKTAGMEIETIVLYAYPSYYDHPTTTYPTNCSNLRKSIRPNFIHLVHYPPPSRDKPYSSLAN